MCRMTRYSPQSKRAQPSSAVFRVDFIPPGVSCVRGPHPPPFFLTRCRRPRPAPWRVRVWRNAGGAPAGSPGPRPPGPPRGALRGTWPGRGIDSLAGNSY